MSIHIVVFFSQFASRLQATAYELDWLGLFFFVIMAFCEVSPEHSSHSSAVLGIPITGPFLALKGERRRELQQGPRQGVSLGLSLLRVWGRGVYH